MMKEEFESRIGRGVSEAEYKEIEYVYTWHPAISDTEGKDQVAAIFNVGGMVVIRSMKEAAIMGERLENELRAEMLKVERLKSRIQKLKDGDNSFERCLKEAERLFDLAETPEQLENMFSSLAGEYGCDLVADVRQTIDA